MLPGFDVAPVGIGRLKTRTKTSKAIADAIANSRKNLRWPSNYTICSSVRDLGEVAREIATHRIFAYDTETSGLNPWHDSVHCVSFFVGGKGYLVNFDHTMLPQIPRDQFKSILGPYFTDPLIQRVGFNISFDNHFLEESMDIPAGEQFFDGYVAACLLYPERTMQKGLKPLAERFLGETSKAYDQQFGKTAWTVIDPQVSAYYAIHDAELTWKWYEYAMDELRKAPALLKLLTDLEMPTSNIFYETERDGLEVDIDYLRDELGARLSVDIAAVELDIRLQVGDPDLNLSSPEQVAELLFDKLKLRRYDGNSTARVILEKLQDTHPVVPLIMEHRALYKLKTAFVDSLGDLVTLGADGKFRVHPRWKITGSESGRMSCEGPNLLQMPSRSGDAIRRAFVAGDGWMYVSKDFSGQELRIQASLSKDPNLIEIIVNDRDFYSEVAAIFYGGTATDYTKHGVNADKRDKAKIAILALSYGAEAPKLATVFGCTKQQAADFIVDFFRRFPGLQLMNNATISFARRNEYIQDILGRRRPVKYLPYMSPGQEKALDRICANNPVQSSAAEQTKIALLLCHQHLKDNGYKSRVVMSIHDEILFRVWKEEWETTNLSAELDYIMCHAYEFPGVPMKITTEVYPERWAVQAA